jgi:lysine 2,3-aminomutase
LVEPTSPARFLDAMNSSILDPAHVDPPTADAAISPAALAHRALRGGSYWQTIPGYASIVEEEFGDHRWQQRRTVTGVRQLREAVGDLVPESFYEDLGAGLEAAPMALRISPHLLALIDWRDPQNDPIRTQFLPLHSRQVPNHPMLRFDSLHEQEDSPVPGLTHRYRDKALFLPQDSCPVYCRFCTRSYAVGNDTPEIAKLKLSANAARWEQAFAYMESKPELEDIVISGGDSFNLSAANIEAIGKRLLEMPNIRRIRYATKGLCVLPQKILTDEAWLGALTRVVELGRKLHKDVVVHTHFNHPNEVVEFTARAMGRLVERGIHVRNQTVLQRGVNDTPAAMGLLIKRLSHVNVHPYYVYTHDMVPGVEDLRTSLAAAQDLEKHVRGCTAGFNTPHFVVDTMGGGGKRDIHSAEYYDRATGVAVFRSPSVKPGGKFLYFDPIASLGETQRWRWTQPCERRAMIDEALARG